jgi:pyruvate formate lyase activating enzyme
LIKEIEKDVLFYDESGGGVTFSGGEPLSQPGIPGCAAYGLPPPGDSRGAGYQRFRSGGSVDRILPRLQLVLFDLKIMDADRHRRYTGVSNRIILENLKRIAGSGTPVRLRLPLIPGMTDDDANLTDIVRFAGSLETLDGIDLLPFHRIGEEKYRRLGLVDTMAGAAPPSPLRVAEIKDIFEREGFVVTLGG